MADYQILEVILTLILEKNNGNIFFLYDKKQLLITISTAPGLLQKICLQDHLLKFYIHFKGQQPKYTLSETSQTLFILGR